jgi:hypothetical protein
MRIDTCTKTILAVIALLLAVIVLRPLANPQNVAHAQQGIFGPVQLTGGGGDLWVIDKNTGQIWVYAADSEGTVVRCLGKMVEVGKPLVR